MVLFLKRVVKKKWAFAGVIFPLNTANVISGFINLVRFTFFWAQVGCWTPTSPIWARPSHASAIALVLLGANQHRKKKPALFQGAIFMEDS